jgi:hypothetical protein
MLIAAESSAWYEQEWLWAASAAIVAAIAALFSFGAFLATWRAVRPVPKLKGAITFAWTVGYNTSVPGVPAGRLVALHILLTNASAHPVHPLRYKVEVQKGDQWIEGLRIQKWQTGTMRITIGANDIAFTQEHLVDFPPRPVHHGAPLMGFLVHLVPGIANEREINYYRVTVTDVFGGTITFKARAIDVHQAQGDPDGGFTAVEAFRHAGATVTPRP